MQFSKQTQKIQISQVDILQTQIQLLNTSGPSLALFATNISNPIKFLKQPEPNFTYSQMIVADKDSNSKIRCFYYCLLHLIYECESTDTSRGIEQEFKKFAYNEKNRIANFPLQEIQTKYRQFYNGKLLMKILIEFLQVISYTRNKGNLYNFMLKYPIIDFILILIFRSYLVNQLKKTQYIRMCNEVSVQCLIKLFIQKFNLPVKKKSNYEYLFEVNGLVIKEESQCLLIREEKYFDLSNFKDLLLYGGQQNNKIKGLNFQMEYEQRRPESQISLPGDSTPKFPVIYNPFNQKFRSHDFQTDTSPKKIINKEQQSKHNENEISFSEPIISSSINMKQVQPKNNSPNNFFSKLNIRYQQQFDILLNNEKISQINNNNSKKTKNNEIFPTIQEAKNQFEYNVYDGVTSHEVMKFLSPKTIEGLNKSKQISIQNIYKNKQSQKQIIKQKIQQSQKELSKHKINKRYSMLSPEQIQDLFSNKDKNKINEKSLEKSAEKNYNYNYYQIKQSKTQKKAYNITQSNQTDNTIRLSRQTQQVSCNIPPSPKIKMKYQAPPLPPTRNKMPKLISNQVQLSPSQLLYISPKKNKIIIEERCSPNSQFYNLSTENPKKFAKPKKLSMQDYNSLLSTKQY